MIAADFWDSMKNANFNAKDCKSICWELLYKVHKLRQNGLIIENVLVDLHSRYSENNLMQQC